MNKKLLITALIIAVGISTSSAVPTKVNNPIRGQTFSFVTRKSNALTADIDDRAAIHKMIQNAITKNLAGRGLNAVGSGGDVTVAYLTILGNNVSTERVSQYFGYSDDVEKLHDKAQKAYTRSKNPNDFEAGTLLIDIIDGKSFKLLKRGYVTRPRLQGMSANQKAARIQEAVDAILQDIKIKK
jgi:hypothetical protein